MIKLPDTKKGSVPLYPDTGLLNAVLVELLDFADWCEAVNEHSKLPKFVTNIAHLF